MSGVSWNPWHGCSKYSEGCAHCYVYRTDARFGKDSSEPTKNADFALPVARRRDGEYKIPSGETVWTCFTSDFFLDKADKWRKDAWSMMRERRDLDFFIVTKRIERFESELPDDWGEGYPNVTICCTCENQKRADERLPIFLQLPIAHKRIVCEPLLERMDISPYLGGWIEGVTVGGESGNEARVCDYDWVLSLHKQCREKGVSFYFKQTGAKFRKDNKIYLIERCHQFSQARKAGLDFEV